MFFLEAVSHAAEQTREFLVVDRVEQLGEMRKAARTVWRSRLSRRGGVYEVMVWLQGVVLASGVWGLPS